MAADETPARIRGQAGSSDQRTRRPVSLVSGGSLTLDGNYIDSLGEFLMKGLLIAAGVVAILYVWDQQYEQGQYTYAVQRMVIQMRHSLGV